MMFDQCFELTGKLTETEKSLLYYIAGDVAKKEDLCTEDDDESKKKPHSEFTTLVSQGKLLHPNCLI